MALIKRVPLRPQVDFIGRRTLFLIIGLLIVGVSIGAFALRGLNLGVDFRGGTLIEVQIEDDADISEVRSRLGGLGLGDISIQEFGAPDDLLINVQQQDGGEGEQAQVIDAVRGAIDDVVVEYRRTEFVGPRVGAELQQAGLIATVLALAGIALYVWFRFEWNFAVAALAALIHDIIGTVGFFAVTQIDFNLSTVAAVLTIAGYSINDTVVVFDRVRDMMRRYKRKPIASILNMAINETLVRSILTSVTTLIALFALAIFGGEVIRSFVYGLIWGVTIGTFSSIGLAAPLLIYTGLNAGGSDKAEAEAGAQAASGGRSA